MKLIFSAPPHYRVKRGQTLSDIAKAYSLPPRVIAAHNHLRQEPKEGEVLSLPASGNLYTVKGGESKSLLCGSREKFREKNCTDCFYPGQTVLL